MPHRFTTWLKKGVRVPMETGVTSAQPVPAHCVCVTFDADVLLLTSYVLSDSFDMIFAMKHSRVTALTVHSFRRRRCHVLNIGWAVARKHPLVGGYSYRLKGLRSTVDGAEEAGLLQTGLLENRGRGHETIFPGHSFSSAMLPQFGFAIAMPTLLKARHESSGLASNTFLWRGNGRRRTAPIARPARRGHFRSFARTVEIRQKADTRWTRVGIPAVCYKQARDIGRFCLQALLVGAHKSLPRVGNRLRLRRR
jgi:hypothetical protein